MIVYKNILQKLKAAGYSAKRIRQENIFPESVLTRLRNNKPVSTETLDKICNILRCDISDIIEQRPDDKLHS